MTGLLGINGIILLSFFGCNTVREISIEVMVPAEVTIPTDVQSVTFVNRSYNPWLTKAPEDTIHRPPEDLFIIDSIVNNKFFLGIFDALNSSLLFDIDKLVLFQFRRADSIRFPDPLSEEELLAISETVLTDAIICLEGYSMTDSLAVFNNLEDAWFGDYYETESGVVFFVQGTIQWRIYDLINRSVIDEFITTDTTDWTVYGYYQEAMNELPEVIDAYREFAYQRGYDFGMRVSPIWSQVRRFYFISGNKNIRKAADYVYEGKWEKAADLWKLESGSDDPQIAAKSAFNLALYSEQRDLLIPAIDWAKKSYELINEKYTKIYIEILEHRKMNKLKLQQQIPLK